MGCAVYLAVLPVQPQGNSCDAPSHLEAPNRVVKRLSMDGLVCDRVQHGRKILGVAETLLSDGKLSDGQYLELCDGAKALHEGINLMPDDVDNILSVINENRRLCSFLTQQKCEIEKTAKKWKLDSQYWRKKFEVSKRTALARTTVLESLINKKAYASALSAIRDHKNMVIKETFDFDEAD